MLLQRLFDHLAVSVEPFATCEIANGWRLSLPSLDFVNFHFVLSGSGSLEEPGDGRHPLGPHTLAVVPPQLAHSIVCGIDIAREARPRDDQEPVPVARIVAGPAEEAELLIACGRVRATYGDGLGLFDTLREPIVLDFSDSVQMRDVFRALLDERSAEGAGSATMMAALMNQCLVLVFRRLAAESDGVLPWLGGLDDPRMAAVLEAILDHPEQPHTLDSLADLAHMSRSAFAKRFHDSLGRTPIRYLREVRLRRAAQLLHRNSTLSIAAIARRVGFDSRSQFSRAFSDLFGVPPSEYRELSPG